MKTIAYSELVKVARKVAKKIGYRSLKILRKIKVLGENHGINILKIILVR